MTRSKVLLAITTSCLAIAAVAATKISKFTNPVPGYFTNANGTTCTQSIVKCTNGGSLVCKTTGASRVLVTAPNDAGVPAPCTHRVIKYSIEH